MENPNEILTSEGLFYRNVTNASTKKQSRFKKPFRFLAGLIAGFYIFTYILRPLPVQAQPVVSLPAPGTMMPLSQPFTPVLIKGIVTYPENPLKFDFLIDKGNENISKEQLRDESLRLIKYFMAALTVPDKDMWVNLSPGEDDRVIPQEFGYTDMGRDLLSQDYILKQVAASLSYPEKKLGHDFWGELRQELADLGEDLNLDFLNKVWIVPESAEVYVRGNSAFVSEGELDVLMDRTYRELKDNRFSEARHNETDMYGQVFQELLLPPLRKDVNAGKNFAELRQIYYSVILATWFKRNLRQTFLGAKYVGTNTVNGIDIEDKQVREKIYEQYMEAFKKGVYSLIREEYDRNTQEIYPQRYFSGGIGIVNFGEDGEKLTESRSQASAEKVTFEDGYIVSTQIQAGENEEGPIFDLKSANFFVSSDTRGPQYEQLAQEELAQNKKKEDDAMATKAASEVLPDVINVEKLPSLTAATNVDPVVKKPFRKGAATVFLLSALLFSSFLLAPKANAATFQKNTKGELVAVVEQGDSFSAIVHQIRNTYRTVDGKNYDSSRLKGSLWGEDGVVAYLTPQVKGAAGVLHTAQQLPFNPDLVSEKAFQTLTGEAKKISSVTPESQEILVAENDNGSSLQMNDLSPAVDPIDMDFYLADNGGLDDLEIDDAGQNLSPNPFAGITSSGGDPDPDSVIEIETPKVSVTQRTSTFFQSMASSIKGNGVGVLAPLSAFLFFMATFFRGLAKRGFLGSKGANAKDLEFEERMQTIKAFIYRELQTRKIAETRIGSAVDALEGEMLLDFAQKMGILKDSATKEKLLPQIKQRFQTELSVPLKTKIRNLFSLSEWDASIERKAKELATAYTNVYRDKEAIVLSIENFIDKDLEYLIIDGVESLLKKYRQKLFANNKVKDELSLVNDLYKTYFIAKKGTNVATYANAAAMQMTKLLDAQVFSGSDAQPLVSKKNDTLQSEAENSEMSPAQFSLVRQELLTSVAGGLAAIFTGQDLTVTLLATGMAPFIYRLGIAASLWFHEMGHVFQGFPKSLTLKNLRGNISALQWLKILIPFKGEIPSEDELGVKVIDVSSKEDRSIRKGGFFASLGLFVIQLPLLYSHMDNPSFALFLPFTLGSLWTLTQATRIDLINMLRGKFIKGVYACGISGKVSGRRDPIHKIASEINIVRNENMIKYTDIRGRISAGVKVQASNAKGQVFWVGPRLLNQKRGDLPKAVNKKFRASLSEAEADGLQGVGGTEVTVGHVRYPTFSPATKKDTHPHQWMDDREVGVWIIESSIPQKKSVSSSSGKSLGFFSKTSDTESVEEVESSEAQEQPLVTKVAFKKKLDVLGNVIAHNGDFYAWYLYGQNVSNGHIGLWLNRVLHTPNDATCDSPKIAGLIDFLLTQGMWDASVRLGYYLTMVDSLSEVFGGEAPSINAPNTALTNEEIDNIAFIFENVFSQYTPKFELTSDIKMRDLFTVREGQTASDIQQKNQAVVEEMKKDILKKMQAENMFTDAGEERLQAFVDMSVESFFENDLEVASMKFRERAEFHKNTFALEIGSTFKTDGVVTMAMRQPLTIGVNLDLQEFLIGSESEATKIQDGDGSPTHRFVLDQRGVGEIVTISRQPKGSSVFPLSVYSPKLKRYLTEEEIRDRLEELHDNPYISQIAEIDDDDPVGKDISEIPYYLQRIKDDWKKKNSFNSQTADHILLKLMQKDVANQIKNASLEYGSIDGKIKQFSYNAAQEWAKKFVPVLDVLGEKDSASVNGLIQSQIVPLLSRYVESIVHNELAREKNIDSEIKEEALRISVDLLTQKKNEDGIFADIRTFIDGTLDEYIAGSLENAYENSFKNMEVFTAYLMKKISAMSQLVFLRGEDDPGKRLDLFKGFLQAGLQDLGLSMYTPKEEKPYDLLVSGIEISLWLGEAFASDKDLKRLFPNLKIGSISANKLLEDSEAAGIGPDTIVLMISQSGQTFGSLNATISENGEGSDESDGRELQIYEVVEELEDLLPGQVFVLAGDVDTLMGRAVGQTYKKGAPFGRRILSNLTGFRPAEASTLTATATGATLNELLLHMTEGVETAFPSRVFFDQDSETSDFEDLEGGRDRVIAEAERLTGITRKGDKLTAEEHRHLMKSSNRWGQHILDAPISNILNWIHLYAAVVGSFMIMNQTVGLFDLPLPQIVVNHFQYLWFLLLPDGITRLRRLISHRTIFARSGNRSIFIGGPSHVHQILEITLTKFFSLSRKATAIEGQGANPSDHMPHRLLHRSVRGTLIWMGMPDGRMKKLERLNDAYQMTARQFKSTLSLGIGPEVFAVGRERERNSNVSDDDMTIAGDMPMTKERLQMIHFDRYESLLYLISGQVYFHNMARKVATLGLPKALRWLWPYRWDIHRTQAGTRIATTASPQSPAEEKQGNTPQSLADALLEKSKSGETGWSEAILPEGQETDLGGIDMSERWLNLKEFVVHENGNPVNPLGGQPLTPNLTPVHWVAPRIIDIQPLTPVTIHWLLGSKQKDDSSKQKVLL